MEQRLQRGRLNRMVFGVCVGLARYFDVDVTLVRIIFVLLAFASGVGIIAYIIMAIVMPQGTELADSGRTGVEPAQTSEQIETTSAPCSPPADRFFRDRHSTAAVLLILIGLLILLSNLGLLRWLDWGRTWPILLIAIGVFLLLQRSRR